MTELFFAVPWWLPLLLALGGAAAFVAGNNRRAPGTRNAGAVAVALAVLLALVSYFVDTPVEAAVRNSQRFVAAFQKQDWTTFSALLDRKVSLGGQGVSLAIYADRDELVNAAQAAQRRYQFTSLRIPSIDGRRVDSVIVVYLTVISEQQATLGRPFPSSWEFEWQDFGEGYRLSRITALQIAGQAPDRLRQQFPAK